MKKKKYEHLDQIKRDRLQALRENGHTQKDIAGILGVDQSTISRELMRNRRKIKRKGGTINGRYESSIAQHKAYLKRYYSKFQWKKINQNSNLELYIVHKLKSGWSPDDISGRMIKDREPFYASKTAIYEWLRSNQGQKYCVYLYSRRYRAKKYGQKKAKRVLIPNKISITLRPRGATNRTRYGHYENDTMVSGKKTGSKAALTVMYEMKAKYIDAKKIKNLRPGSNNEAILKIKEDKIVKSMTFDNGIENTKHQELNVPTFFCDPYSAWQKGGVENCVKMIRKYIPKGCDINDYSDNDIKNIVTLLNNKPRKSLGYRTPYEVMIENNLFKKEYALEG
ncbi:MAG: IS30 family transposase [Candidatus Staskawiczbacteria bacterium]|nr:IS30 family transposase [Candidatus Staskawiczbacteria bacterium]